MPSQQQKPGDKTFGSRNSTGAPFDLIERLLDGRLPDEGLQEPRPVSSLVDFRRVMQALALRTGQLLNQAEVSRDTAVPQPTLGRWLNLLEAGRLATRVPAFAGNRTKRILKRTKLHWLDPPGRLYRYRAQDLWPASEAVRHGSPKTVAVLGTSLADLRGGFHKEPAYRFAFDQAELLAVLE